MIQKTTKQLTVRETAWTPEIITTGQKALAESTQAAYTTDIEEFYRTIGKDIPDTTPGDIQRFIDYLSGKGYRNSTINRKVYAISKICKLYTAAGLINKNPVESLGKLKRVSRTVNRQIDIDITKDDISKVIQQGGITAVIVETLATTGLRISELINIKHTDIKPYAEGAEHYHQIRIVGKGNKERFIHISAAMYNKIRNTCTTPGCTYLFHSRTGKRLDRTNIHHQIKRLFEKTTRKAAHPHSMRHFYATYKIIEEKYTPKAVSMKLGHSTTAITMDMYTHDKLSAQESTITF